MNRKSFFIVGYSLHGNVQSSQILNFFNIAQDEFGLKVVNEFTKEYDGQKGIGSVDKEREGLSTSSFLLKLKHRYN